MPVDLGCLTEWTLSDLTDAEKQINSELARRGRKIGSKKYQIVVEAWNEVAKNHVRLREVRALGDRRLAHLRKRMNEPVFADEHKTIFEIVGRSPFLRGERGKWVASFDWMIANNSNYVKVYEGRYETQPDADSKGEIPDDSSHKTALREMLGDG